MKEHIYEGKNEEEVLKSAYEDLSVDENNSYYYVTKEKVGLLKKEVVTVHMFTQEEVIEFIKDYLTKLTNDMGIKITMETAVRDEHIIIRMFSDNDSLLIGYEGRTLKALSLVLKQVVNNQIHKNLNINLDVSNYQEKRDKRIERLAKNIAREVEKTKNPVTMENMNSYERRIVHNILADSDKVYTKSEGEEPNRHVIVYPKES